MKDIEHLQMEGFRGAPQDWEKGPSALDKAVHLFFFTEIIRGVYYLLQMHKRCHE